jgi:hypothetical protein
MSKPVPIHGGSSRPCSPACALLDAPRCLTASQMVPPVHGVFTTRATTPDPGCQHQPGWPEGDADPAWLRGITCQAHGQSPFVQPRSRFGVAGWASAWADSLRRLLLVPGPGGLDTAGVLKAPKATDLILRIVRSISLHLPAGAARSPDHSVYLPDHRGLARARIDVTNRAGRTTCFRAGVGPRLGCGVTALSRSSR